MLVFTKIIDDIKKQLAEETTNRIANDNALSAAIDTEVERAISAETALNSAIQDETSRAVAREDEIESEIPQGGHYSLKTGEILTIPSKTDGINNIEIAFDGDFGEF